MSTRTILVVAASICLSAAAASAQDPTPDQHATVNQRIENQHDRIQAGVKDDQLTKREATHLAADDAKIRAQAEVERKANGGTLTKGEKKQLKHELNRNSRKIARGRHNGRTPKA